jgi:protein-S-isoprenylcysteine O-methyltransferase Ste14
MNQDTPPNVIPWPPIILFCGIASGYLMRALAPLPWAEGTARDILQGAGFVLAALAALLYFLSIRELWRHKTTVNPTGKSAHLVTTGPFAFSRNPIYLANVFLVTGIAFATGNAWMLAIAAAMAWLEQNLAIKREEKHLEARFGKAWRDYTKNVRRWL